LDGALKQGAKLMITNRERQKSWALWKFKPCGCLGLRLTVVRYRIVVLVSWLALAHCCYRRLD